MLDGEIGTTYVSFYIPPRSQEEIITRMARATAPESPVVAGGDGNVDTAFPSSPDQARIATDLLGALHAWGASAVDNTAHTHRDRHGLHRLDLIAAAASIGDQWRC